MLLQAPYRESNSSPGVMFGRLSPHWPYGLFIKRGVPNYILWTRLSPSQNYWYIQLKVTMIVIRVVELQLGGKGEFKESNQLFLLCWMQVMILSGTMLKLLSKSLGMQ